MAASARKAARRWRGPCSRSLARMRGISARGEARHRRRPQRPGRPAADGLRLHAPVVADVPVPLPAQVVHRAARRVRAPPPPARSGSESPRACARRPQSMSSETARPAKPPTAAKTRAAHREVGRGGEVVAGDGQLLAEAVDEVEGLGRVRPAGRLGEDPDGAAEHAAGRIGGEGGEDRREPAGLGDAVGVEEGEDLRPRQRDAAVARRARSRLRLAGEMHPGKAGDDVARAAGSSRCRRRGPRSGRARGSAARGRRGRRRAAAAG